MTSTSTVATKQALNTNPVKLSDVLTQNDDGEPGHHRTLVSTFVTGMILQSLAKFDIKVVGMDFHRSVGATFSLKSDKLEHEIGQIKLLPNLRAGATTLKLEIGKRIIEVEESEFEKLPELTSLSVFLACFKRQRQ